MTISANACSTPTLTLTSRSVRSFSLARLLTIMFTCALAAGCNPELSFVTGSLSFPSTTAPNEVAFLWQNEPNPVEVRVRNEGSRPGRARLVYHPLAGPDRDTLRLGPTVTIPPGEERVVSMVLDVQPQWTEGGRFPFRLFLADEDVDEGKPFSQAIYRDDRPANHEIVAGKGAPVRPLYDRVRLTLVRVRAMVPMSVALTANWSKTHPETSKTFALAPPFIWPIERGEVDLPVGEWIDVNHSIEVELGETALAERSQALPWHLNLDIDGQVVLEERLQTVTTTPLVTREWRGVEWSMPDNRMTLTAGQIGGWANMMEVEVRIEGLASSSRRPARDQRYVRLD